MIRKQDHSEDDAQAIRYHCDGLDELTDAARDRLAALLLTPGQPVELPEFFAPDAADRFGPIPADLPTPETGWFNALMQREDGLKPSKHDAQAVSTQITPEQREDLSTRHQYARFMVHTLIERCGHRPDNQQGAAIVIWADHAEDIKHRLNAYMLPMAVWSARRFRTSWIEFDERVSVACAALLYAIDRHDPSKSSLSHYAQLCMNGRLIARYRKSKRWRREWITGANVTEEGDERTALEAAPESGRDIEGLADLDRILAEPGLLDARERQIITWRFGLKVDHGLGEHTTERLTLEEAGQRLGLSRERVNQIERAALEKVRCRFIGQPVPRLTRDLSALVSQRRRGKLPDVLDAIERRKENCI